MENRELLTFILGYLFELKQMEKIPRKKLKLIQKFIKEFKIEKEIEECDSIDNTIEYLKRESNRHNYNRHNDHNSLMEGFDYDGDNDQQDPNFW
ncbi:hypothetical protein [Polaribacter atrinae]|uniref:Uncharacterized protein n=1 Tax=Polaribacter atrinae TaxID=1333662 RepID=A0A176SW26_9FLAO|nr:hypothetical protein [Polaribacter atrinae]OAD39453.1 hypothetical protein LPB303_17035 [Polaribacter atrinae]